MHQQVEVIVVNDGSTDESPAVAHAHAACDQRVVVVDKPNEGYGASCNLSLIHICRSPPARGPGPHGLDR